MPHSSDCSGDAHIAYMYAMFLFFFASPFRVLWNREKEESLTSPQIEYHEES